MTYPNRNNMRGPSPRKRGRRIPVLRILSITMILAGFTLFGIEMFGFSQRETLLAEDVTVGGVPVGGMTVNAAVTTWEQVFNQPVVLRYGDAPPIILEPAQIDWRLNSNTMRANAQASTGDFWPRFIAYLTGQQFERSGATVPLLANYQEGLLRSVLDDIARRYDRAPGNPGYDVATLTVYSGTPGTQLDIEEAMDRIDAALRDPVNRVVTLPIGDSAASRPNLQLLRSLIIDYLDTNGFIYDSRDSVASVFIQDLQTGEELNILGDVAFSAASTMKVPILIDFYRTLNAPPSQDEAFIMANSLLCSRNSSSNILLRLIGQDDMLAGVRSVTETAQKLGARNTFISAPFQEVTGQAFGSTVVPRTSPNPNYNTNPDPLNQTTAEDLGTLYGMIYDCANYGSGLEVAFPNGEFTQNECRQMLELMSGNNLQRLLQGGIPAGVRISHKNGWLTETVGEAGIVYPPSGRNYVISVFLWEESGGFQNFQRLWPLFEGISRAAYNYFEPTQPLLTARTDLPPTAADCEGNYLPPSPALTNLDDIDSWRERPQN